MPSVDESPEQAKAREAAEESLFLVKKELSGLVKHLVDQDHLEKLKKVSGAFTKNILDKDVLLAIASATNSLVEIGTSISVNEEILVSLRRALTALVRCYQAYTKHLSSVESISSTHKETSVVFSALISKLKVLRAYREEMYQLKQATQKNHPGTLELPPGFFQVDKPIMTIVSTMGTIAAEAASKKPSARTTVRTTTAARIPTTISAITFIEKYYEHPNVWASKMGFFAGTGAGTGLGLATASAAKAVTATIIGLAIASNPIGWTLGLAMTTAILLAVLTPIALRGAERALADALMPPPKNTPSP